ncbi:hypothetical protein BAC2_00366 [uncultured bacterium]|nr:hypothetical protein BAC2_00366 [uncultured bacterium]
MVGVRTELFIVPSAALFTLPDDFKTGVVTGGQPPADFVAVGADDVRVGDATGLSVGFSETRGVAEGVPGRGVLLLTVTAGRGVVVAGWGWASWVGSRVLTGVSKSWARANLVGASVGSGVVTSFASEQASAASPRIMHARIARRLNSLTFISIQSELARIVLSRRSPRIICVSVSPSVCRRRMRELASARRLPAA